MLESDLLDLEIVEGGGCWSISLGDPVCLSVFISETAKKAT